jgi:hypothetical protein
MPNRGLYRTANATWVEHDFSAPRLFSFFLSLNSNSLFQDLTSLRGGPKTASGKESLSSSYIQKVFWLGHSPVSPKG